MFNKLQINRLLAIVLCMALTVTGFTLFGNTVKTINIADGISSYSVRTFSSNITAALTAAKLPSDNYRIVSSETANNTTSISIEYLFPVYITVGDKTVEVETAATTVGEVLAAANIQVDQFDLVYPTVDTEISETVYIDYTNIDYVSGTYTEAVPYKTVTVNDKTMAAGTEKYEAGTDGVQQVNYTAKYVNGENTETTVDSTVLLSAAVDAKRIVGTKVQAVKTSSDVKSVSTLTPAAPIELDQNGVPVNYTKCITARATAYTYTGNRCSTGVAPQPGYIAVNPNYIPYGTRMYIRTADGSYIYGYAVAADTGGFIRKHPTGVDLFLSSESACVAFGVRNVEIYILP